MSPLLGGFNSNMHMGNELVLMSSTMAMREKNLCSCIDTNIYKIL